MESAQSNQHQPQDRQDMVTFTPDKSFKAMLENLRTLTSIKKDLPEGHNEQENLSNMIDDHSKQLLLRYEQSPEEQRPSCVDHSDLLHLYTSLEGIPEAKQRLYSIIGSVSRLVYSDNPPSYLGCKDIEVHRCLLHVWASLQLEGIDNKVVARSVLKFFAAHSVKPETKDRNSDSGVTVAQTPKTEKWGNKNRWSIPIASVRFPDTALWGGCMTLNYDDTRGTLTAEDHDRRKSKAGSDMEVEMSRLTNLCYSTSQEYIRLHFDGFEQFVVDLKMHNYLDGQTVIRKIKAAGPPSCVFDLV